MNATLAKALVALVPAIMLFSGSMLLFAKTKTLSSFLQLLGATCLMMVVLAHAFEALNVFPSLRWGLADSAGHYLDLGSLLAGLALFPLGYLWQALAVPRS